MKRKTGFSLGGLAALLLLAAIAPAGAKEQVDSFAGSCSVQGDVTFNPPVTNTTQPLHVVYDASGTCSGTLDGRNISNAPVKLHHAGDSDGSCLGAHTTGPGQGAITFAGGTVIPYTFEFQATGTEVDFTFSGQQSGSAKGHGSFLTTRTPPDVGIGCASGGDAKLPMDLTLSTNSALVNKQRDAGAGGGKGRLHLAGHPHSSRAGQRTQFTFHVTDAGQAAPRAVVHFAGRRAQAGSGGLVRLITALPHPGRYLARASAAGVRGDRLAVRARR